MSGIKNHFHDEITNSQREANNYMDDYYQIQEAHENVLEFYINIKGPDTKSINHMLMLIMSEIKAGQNEGFAEFPLSNDFTMSYHFSKIN